MRESVFSAFIHYIFEIVHNIRSVFSSFWVTAPYLFGSGENRREITEQYPDPVSCKTEDDLPTRSRGILYNDIRVCTGCGVCEEKCPVNCIQIQNEPGPDQTKRWVAVFDIDFGKCISCGICVDYCPTGSLRHTKKYENSSQDIQSLNVSFGRGHLTFDQREKWMKMREQEKDDRHE